MKIKRIVSILLIGLVSACYYQPDTEQNAPKTDFFGNAPQCRQETEVAIYDKQGTFVVPGCVDYEQNYMGNTQEEEYEPDFPDVPNNKYDANQVVMQNLNTRVLAYCRGTEAEIEACVARLQDSCYTKVSEIPYMSAKYDFLKRGTYPTRRWRNGESVPRW
ncbi:MAG: hypothetical protein IJ852_03355 [Alphaproteobacteria bacterium]|nr:hypothetical protein [Alphaproteobacteria bacterium]